MTANRPVLPLVYAAAFQPAGCQRVAIALANLHDEGGGPIRVTMGCIAGMASLSKVQARKHVHALVSMDVLHVVANAHGGAPGTAPLYQFNTLRLSAFTQRRGGTGDLFVEAVAAPQLKFSGENEDGTAVPMVAALEGRPGFRIVRFFRVKTGASVEYGELPLKAVLLPLLISKEWAGGWLQPSDGAPAWAYAVYIPLVTAAQIQAWAQSTALGRIESVETA